MSLEGYSALAAPASVDRPHETLEHRRVLIVRDDPDALAALEPLLRGDESSAETVHSLTEALSTLDGDSPVVIAILPPGQESATSSGSGTAGNADEVHIRIGTKMKEVERTMIVRTLDANGWNKQRAARILGISRRSLYNKLERYQIPRQGGATPPATP